MSRTLFPVLPSEIAAQKTDFPLYREVLVDEKAKPVTMEGEFVFCEGAQAVASWARMALEVVRYRHVIYSMSYGSELETLIGQPFTDDLKAAEAPRIVREALVINPYIKDVHNIEVDFTRDRLTISAVMDTIYGEVTIYAA